MFDTLVESTSHRRSAKTLLYFAVSTAVWTVVLTGIAIAGIMTYDESLNADFQNLALVAQVKVTPPPRRAESQPAVQHASAAVFKAVMHPPTEISTVRTPPTIGGGPLIGGITGPSTGDMEGWDDGSGAVTGDAVAHLDQITIPPPQRPHDPAPDNIQTIARRPVSKGPLNGVAIRRDQPPYPEMAKVAGVTGSVVVEVTVSESGDVVSAHAISGHPFFTRVAEQSARNWKFSPTTLGGVHVKVVGTITFVFKRSV